MNILKTFTLVALLCVNSAWGNSAEQFDPALRDALKKSFATADSFEDRYVAEVWLVDMGGRIRNYVKDDLERVEILRYAHAEAQRHELPIDLVSRADPHRKPVQPFCDLQGGCTRPDAGDAVLEKRDRPSQRQPHQHQNQPALRLYHPETLPESGQG